MNKKEETLKEIKNFSNRVKKNILEMAFSAGASSSHFGGALSIVDIVSVLFGHRMKLNDDPNWDDRDRFILSKGHACLAYYAALCEVGYISKDELKTFEKNDSNLLGHPVTNKKLGIDFSNGSLGMGLSLGIGVSLALKKKNKDNKVYTVLGDGECNEGSVWEAAMAASNYKLDNLFAIIDKNNFQQTGLNQDIMNTDNLMDKWFNAEKKSKKPKAIIANTVKGKGFSFSENNNNWHHAVLSKSQYEIALKELEIS